MRAREASAPLCTRNAFVLARTKIKGVPIGDRLPDPLPVSPIMRARERGRSHARLKSTLSAFFGALSSAYPRSSPRTWKQSTPPLPTRGRRNRRRLRWPCGIQTTTHRSSRCPFDSPRGRTEAPEEGEEAEEAKWGTEVDGVARAPERRGTLPVALLPILMRNASRRKAPTSPVQRTDREIDDLPRLWRRRLQHARWSITAWVVRYVYACLA
jgi:hypothetical protein